MSPFYTTQHLLVAIYHLTLVSSLTLLNTRTSLLLRYAVLLVIRLFFEVSVPMVHLRTIEATSTESTKEGVSSHLGPTPIFYIVCLVVRTVVPTQPSLNLAVILLIVLRTLLGIWLKEYNKLVS